MYSKSKLVFLIDLVSLLYEQYKLQNASKKKYFYSNFQKLKKICL